MTKKRIALLGATGSIGKSALDILRKGRDDFALVLASAHRNEAALNALKSDFPQARLVLSGGDDTLLLRAIEEARADVVLNGIAGAAGLAPSFAALRAGADLALANKETIVMAGPLVLECARAQGKTILPVDSEHAAIAALLAAHGREALAEVILTASGGPFRTWSREQLAAVRAEQALAHPTWRMGPKITCDSATLANKGLEVIEAVHLFNMSPDAVRVVVHPQSVVHGLIRFRDGAIYAQLSPPDMRLPIQEALYHPRRARFPLSALSFDKLSLDFEAPDFERFPLLALAYEAARRGGAYPVAFNAANEEAVAAFLAGAIGFLDIAGTVAAVMEADWTRNLDELEAVWAADARARSLVNKR